MENMEKYDIVIVAHEKDFNNLKFIVEYAEKNLEFDEIHIIVSERKEYLEYDILKEKTSRIVSVHKESDILKIDKSKIKYRPNWIYQMLLKFFQNVTKNDKYLIIEADCIILNKINFIDEDKFIFYLCRNENHGPYYNFSQKIFRIGREYDHSFISEFMIYDKKIIKEMLVKTNCEDVECFLKLVYDTVESNCFPSDYDLYGNFCYVYFPEKTIIRHLDYFFCGREETDYPFWSDHEIIDLIDKNRHKPVISFHTWQKP
jgi:hypothetical protein